MNKERTDAHIVSVTALLDEKLLSDPVDLKYSLKDTEVLYIKVVQGRATAQAELSNKRLQYLHPKDAQYTDMDRKIMLDANTSEEQARYELLAGMEKALEQRIAVIQTLLVQ